MDVSAIASSLSGMPSELNLKTLPDQPPAVQRKIVAGQFEAILLRQFLSQSVGSMMGGDSSAQGSVYGYMLTDALAQKMAAGGGLGLSKIIAQQLKPVGEKDPPPPAQNKLIP
jgi:Rod binding domain-containing protein